MATRKNTTAETVEPEQRIGLGNLSLWMELEPTDPGATKQFNRAGFKGTAINPCYVAKRLTQEFGPCGLGWRFVLENEQYVQGHTLGTGDRSIVHVVRGHLDYCTADRDVWVSTGPQFGQTTFIGERNDGRVYTDEEAPKKSITDCLSKCAVMLGLSADIHLGLWDGNKYVNDAEGQPEPPPASKPRAPRKAAEPVETAGPPIESPLWADIENAETPQRLAEVFDKATGSARLYDVPKIWEVVCEKVAGRFRALNLPDDPASKYLLDGLQKERARLDAGSTANASTEQEASGAVPKTRSRKKPVST